MTYALHFSDVDGKLLDNQEGYLSWLSITSSVTSSYTALMSEFPWVSFFILEIEEEREETIAFWNCLLKELDGETESVSLDKCHKKIVAEQTFPSHASNLNNLPIYKWCQLILDSAIEQPLQAVYAQKFFKYFSAKHQDQRLGSHFFEGVINTHYFGRILNKFKNISDFYKAAVVDEASNNTKESIHVAMSEIFQAYVLWLEDMFILDEKLHLPSVSPKMLPHLLASVLDSSKVVDFEIVNMMMASMNHTDEYAKEWRRLHFRSDENRKQRSLTPKKEEGFKKDLSLRLSTYDPPAPLPLNKLASTSVIQVCDTWFCDETTFDATILPYLSALTNFSR